MNRYFRTYWRNRRIVNFYDGTLDEIEYAKVNELHFDLIKIDPKKLREIKDPSEELQLAAISENPEVFAALCAFRVKQPSETVQLAAVSKLGRNIFFIKKPSEAVQLAAVKQDGNAIRNIKYPTERVKALHKKLWVK